MNDDDPKSKNAYEQAVIRVLQHYGLALEDFGRASQGSPAGMENTLRFAQQAARDALIVFLGREPTLEELSQIPPLYEPPVVNASLGHIVQKPHRRGRP